MKKVLQNNTQIQTLTKTRDELLPKLMSGEIGLKAVLRKFRITEITNLKFMNQYNPNKHHHKSIRLKDMIIRGEDCIL